MALKCGIVGLPNVGKSTFFNALTQAGIDAANFPFCTIEPNVGMVNVPDPRLDKIATIANAKQSIPATVQFYDIAGLVAGASTGEGLGNQFLAHIRETQAIVHMVRCFVDDDITHVNGQINPLTDIEVIETELALADIQSIEKAIVKAKKLSRSGDKAAQYVQEQLTQAKDALDLLKLNQLREQVKAHPDVFSSLHLLSTKPVLYVANVSDTQQADERLINMVKEKAQSQGAEVICLSCAMEAEIAQLDPEDQQAFLDDIGQTEPGLNRVIRASYQLLNLQTYFTAGEKEARAWTVPIGAKAPQGAGVIHTDFEHGFIRAEVIAYEDYITHQGENGAKEAGKWRLEGKEYILTDGDVVHFRFNV